MTRCGAACKRICRAARSCSRVPRSRPSVAPCRRSARPPSPTACRCTASRSTGTRAVTTSSSPSTPARAPSAPRRTGWPTSSSTSSSRAARSTRHYRDVNETAERIGAVLNAYTSHDLVAFHVTCRAEVAMEALDLLTDFVGRPHIDAERARPRARRRDPGDRPRPRPARRSLAEHLIDRAAFGDHPLGRPVLGPEEHLRDVQRATPIVGLPRAPLGGRARRRLPRRQPLGAAGQRRGRRALRALPDAAGARALRARAGVRAEHARGGARLQPVAPAHVLPARRSTSPSPRERAALTIYATLLGGSMGSRLFDEIREQRGLAYSVYSVDHAFADVPILQLSAGLDSEQVHRGLPADARDRRRAARRRPDARRRSSAPAPTPPDASCWRSRTPTRSRATRANQAHRLRRGDRPRRRDRAPRRGHLRRGRRRSRATSPDRLAVACVGPHTAEEFA